MVLIVCYNCVIWNSATQLNQLRLRVLKTEQNLKINWKIYIQKFVIFILNEERHSERYSQMQFERFYNTIVVKLISMLKLSFKKHKSEKFNR